MCCHQGDHWPCKWSVEPGEQEGTWRIKTMGHEAGGQPAGWDLAAWNGLRDAKRNGSSTWVAVRLRPIAHVQYTAYLSRTNLNTNWT